MSSDQELEEKYPPGAWPYWRLQTLGIFQPDQIKMVAWGFIGLAVVQIVLFSLLHEKAGGFDALWFWLCAIGTVLLSLIVAYLTFSVAVLLHWTLDHDDAAGREARRPLVEKVRRFAQRQERFRGLLSLDNQQWKEWALDRFIEVVKEWPEEMKEFEEMVASPQYAEARRQLYVRYGQGTAPFEQIWGRRLDVYHWARFKTTREQRAAASTDRAANIETHQVLTEEKIRGMADALKRKPAPSDEDS